MKALNYLPLLALLSCSADPIPSGHYLITTGQETDTLTLAPAPETFTLSSTVLSADSTTYKTTAISTGNEPINSIDVGITGSKFFSVTGVDLDGVRRVQASSYLLDAAQLAGYTVPLFLGRTDAFCRPPGPLNISQGNHPPVGIFWGQVLWMAGVVNNVSMSDGYDLVGWSETGAPSVLTGITCPTTPCEFLSIANYAGRYGLAVGATWARTIDITAGTSGPIDPPSTLSSWADVSGGRSIDAITGAVFVVGPTRSNTASSNVLELDIKGNMTALALSTPRQQAAATYINTNSSHGLLVVGGSPNGPGAEFLDDSGTAFVSLPYPPDKVIGAALLAEPTGSRVWRVGGKVSPTDSTPAPTVVYDLACTANCTFEPLPAFDIVATNAYGFSFGANAGTDADGGVIIDDRRVVIGEKDDGTMVAWRISGSTLTEVPIREPRKYSTVFSLPNGFAALIGGTLSDGTLAKSLELLAY